MLLSSILFAQNIQIVRRPLYVLPGKIVGKNGEYVLIGVTDGVFKLIRDDAGVVKLVSADNDTTAGLSIRAGGNGTLYIGDGDSPVILYGTGITYTGHTITAVDTICTPSGVPRWAEIIIDGAKYYCKTDTTSW